MAIRSYVSGNLPKLGKRIEESGTKNFFGGKNRSTMEISWHLS